ncbi:tetratricopeptide repeat-containing serine/threonine-protein kinase [Burkholderia cepacia]|uniref:protein kinase family protein n=1 Tax=Burkholderia cepacia TaxID=292 RepID=UPI001CF20AB2|nr:protein kinase family protein [Burkholderia cepacia]MCA7933463.1 tetratricopeptide repeat-containing serine/threonine-protein kinase [Burkholderia cepacia]MCA8332905.1 tetratricopeptide repeat-containing serine/threonine-protein kinase [Burkholderia cepacia]
MTKVKSTWDMHSELRKLPCRCGGELKFARIEIVTIDPFVERATMVCDRCDHVSMRDIEIESAYEGDLDLYAEIERGWPAAIGQPYPMAEQKLPKVDEAYNFKTFEINGRWQIFGSRQGSMGSVYLCSDKLAPLHIVVCKRPKTEGDQDTHARECTIAMWLTWGTGASSEHVLGVVDIDSNFPGSPNLILEAVLPDSKGCATLEQWIASGRVTTDLASAWIDHISTALIHCRTIIPGFVHADLKPDNVLVSTGYICKVSDFGLSGSEGEPATPGAPLYRAPELWSGDHPPSVESDIYSVGCIAYEMFTGRHPFGHHDDADGLGHAHACENPAPDANVPQIVYDCLSKDPVQRPTLEQLSDHFSDRTTRRELRKAGMECAVNGAAALITLGRSDLAIYILDRLNEESESALINRGVALSKLGRFEEAKSIYERPELSGNPDAISRSATNLQRHGQSAQALALLEPLLAAGKASISAQITASAAYNDLGRHEDALVVIDVAKRTDPGHTAVLFQLGYTLLKLRRCSAAKSAIVRLEAIVGKSGVAEELRELGRQTCPKIF